MRAVSSCRNLWSMSQIDGGCASGKRDVDGVYHRDAVHAACAECLVSQGEACSSVGERHLSGRHACVVASLPDAYLLLGLRHERTAQEYTCDKSTFHCVLFPYLDSLVTHAHHIDTSRQVVEADVGTFLDVGNADECAGCVVDAQHAVALDGECAVLAGDVLCLFGQCLDGGSFVLFGEGHLVQDRDGVGVLAFCCGDNDIAFLEGDSLHDGQGDVLFSTAVGNGEELGVVGHSGGAGHEQQGCQNVLCLHLLI